jgi:serine/threonine-protein kinase HipA
VSPAETLSVWLYGTKVADIERSARGRFSLRFTEDALDRFGPDSPILSASMPTRTEPYPNALTHGFFEGLLPESTARTGIVRTLNANRPAGSELDESDTFALLGELGRDCAGALVVQPFPDAPPSTRPIGQATPITDDEVAERIARLPQAPLGVDGRTGVRVSLAGVQRKLLLTRRADGGWAEPAEGIPSTHILKPQIADVNLSRSVENEACCMRLAARVGLPVAGVDVAHFGGRPVLVVERFDRRVEDGKIHRVHQEDSCQALGIRASVKYEEQGGPRFEGLAGVLSSFDREGDLRHLLALATFNVAIGNADAHGKNLSFLHDVTGDIALAPAYDLMSTTLYPGVDRTMGMFVDGVRRIDGVGRDRIVNEGLSWGMSGEESEGVVISTLRRIREALDDSRDMAGETNLVEHVRTRANELTDGL